MVTVWGSPVYPDGPPAPVLRDPVAPEAAAADGGDDEPEAPDVACEGAAGERTCSLLKLGAPHMADARTMAPSQAVTAMRSVSLTRVFGMASFRW